MAINWSKVYDTHRVAAIKSLMEVDPQFENHKSNLSYGGVMFLLDTIEKLKQVAEEMEPGWTLTQLRAGNFQALPLTSMEIEKGGNP